jgi:hypothetical protein
MGLKWAQLIVTKFLIFSCVIDGCRPLLQQHRSPNHNNQQHSRIDALILCRLRGGTPYDEQPNRYPPHQSYYPQQPWRRSAQKPPQAGGMPSERAPYGQEAGGYHSGPYAGQQQPFTSSFEAAQASERRSTMPPGQPPSQQHRHPSYHDADPPDAYPEPQYHQYQPFEAQVPQQYQQPPRYQRGGMRGYDTFRGGGGGGRGGPFRGGPSRGGVCVCVCVCMRLYIFVGFLCFCVCVTRLFDEGCIRVL